MEMELPEHVNDELAFLDHIDMPETGAELIDALVRKNSDALMDKAEEMVIVKLDEIAAKENGTN